MRSQQNSDPVEIYVDMPLDDTTFYTRSFVIDGKSQLLQLRGFYVNVSGDLDITDAAGVTTEFFGLTVGVVYPIIPTSISAPTSGGDTAVVVALYG